MDLVELVQTIKPKLSSSSAKIYAVDIRTIAKLFNITINNEDDINALLNQYPHIYPKLKERYSNDKTIRNKLNSIVVLAKYFGNEDAYKHLGKLRDDKNMKIETNVSSKLSDKQNDNFVSDDEYAELVKKIQNKINTRDKSSRMKFLIQDFIILSVYKNINLRADLDNVLLVNSDDIPENGNYIVQRLRKHRKRYKGRYTLFLKEYKTSHTFGILTYTLPNNVHKYLDMYYQQGREYLLYNKHGGIMTSNGLSKRFANIFKTELGKHFTIQMNRIRLASGNIEDVRDFKELKSKLEKEARDAGHSLGMHLNGRYSKNIR